MYVNCTIHEVLSLVSETNCLHLPGSVCVFLPYLNRESCVYNSLFKFCALSKRMAMNICVWILIHARLCSLRKSSSVSSVR